MQKVKHKLQIIKKLSKVQKKYFWIEIDVVKE